tara:strand:- start:282 stop:467 length:186 start_codon:yes stop_codon:yes gene_type:complete
MRKERLNEIRKEMRIEQDLYGVNNTKDFATRIAEEEEILSISLKESRRAKAERLKKEQVKS